MLLLLSVTFISSLIFKKLIESGESDQYKGKIKRQSEDITHST